MVSRNGNSNSPGGRERKREGSGPEGSDNRTGQRPRKAEAAVRECSGENVRQAGSSRMSGKLLHGQSGSDLPVPPSETGSLFAEAHDGSFFDCPGYVNFTNFDDLLEWAADRKASDITIQSGLEVMAEISGNLHRITECRISRNDVESILRHVYGENGPAEILGGRDLDPSYEIRSDGSGSRRFRMNATAGRMGNGTGIQLSIRPLPGTPLTAEQLNLETAIIENFRPRQGLVLITGPTGSGKSTLLATGIRTIVEKKGANEKVLEYSDPIEYVYDGIRMPDSTVFQTQVGKHLRPREEADGNAGFAYCIRNSLRRNPTVIIIGEARDRATIEASVEAALTGHLVYSTMHTMGVGRTIRRAVMPFRESDRMAMAGDMLESLRMIVSQILVPAVGGGRTACREFMVFDERLRETLHREKVEKWPQLAMQLLERGQVIGKTMAMDAESKCRVGAITKATRDQIVSNGGK